MKTLRTSSSCDEPYSWVCAFGPHVLVHWLRLLLSAVRGLRPHLSDILKYLAKATVNNHELARDNLKYLVVSRIYKLELEPTIFENR